MRELDADELVDVARAWPVRSHEVLGGGAVTAYVRDEVQAPDGATMTREYLLHPGAVGVIALDDADRVAVVLQYRHPVAQVMVEPPAGLLDHDGEDFLVAAQRELAEEAGLAASTWRVLVDLFTSPGASQESVRVFLASGLSAARSPEGFVAESEEAHMEVAWARRADLVEAVLAGRVQNPIAVSGLMALEAAIATGRLDALRAPDAPWPAREVRAAQNQRLADADGNPG